MTNTNRTVLTAVDNSAAARPVLATALALEPLLDAHVDAIHVRVDGRQTARAAAEALGVALREVKGDPAASITTEAAQDVVVGVVVGARGRPGGHRPAGPVTLELLRAIHKPVIVVPPEAEPPARLRRMLVAIDTTPGPDVGPTIARALDQSVRVVLVHVDDETSVPSFSDQPQHETPAFAAEFVSRCCPTDAARVELELRIGSPAEEVLATGQELGVDLYAIGRPGELSGERGRVAQDILDRSSVPVLLVNGTNAPSGG